MRVAILAGSLLLAASGASALPQAAQPDAGQAAGGPAGAQPASGGNGDSQSALSTSIVTVTAAALVSPTRVQPVPMSATTPASSAPSASCRYKWRTILDGLGISDGFNYFDVKLPGWPADPRGCGRGLLDNLRGQTSGGSVLDWRCDNSSNSTIVTFKLSTIYAEAGPRAAKAIQLASPGGNLMLDCAYHDTGGR